MEGKMGDNWPYICEKKALNLQKGLILRLSEEIKVFYSGRLVSLRDAGNEAAKLAEEIVEFVKNKWQENS